MRTDSTPGSGTCRAGSSRGMSLLEMIGILGIIALLAGVALPVAIRILDRIAADREIAALKTIGEGLQTAIVRSRSVPNPAYWVSFVATHAGMDADTIDRTPRKRLRVLVPDPASTFLNQNPTQPVIYAQTTAGLAAVPVKSRLILLSCLGGQLNVGTLDEAQFETLWSTGTLPGIFTGRPDDLKMQRIDLSRLFVKLAIGTYAVGENFDPVPIKLGQYSIDGGTTNFALHGGAPAAWYLRGTVLRLFTQEKIPVPDHTHILNADVSFVYEDSEWRTSILGMSVVGKGDLSSVVEDFLKAYPNKDAKYYTSSDPYAPQRRVVTTMKDFMAAYRAWELAGANPAPAQKDPVINARHTMLDAMYGLFRKDYYDSSTTYYPTNMPCL